jgi:hypothetical protein
MESETLEFRGINSSHLKQYFIELGGYPSKENDNRFIGIGWCGEILSEGEVMFTSVFKVNTVVIRFTAENKDDLQSLLKKYRYKTTRVGG